MCTTKPGMCVHVRLFSQPHIVCTICRPDQSHPSIHRHRRRIKTEETGRHFCMGDRMYSIPCRASCFAYYRTILKSGLNSSFSFKSSWCNSTYNSNSSYRQNSYRGKEFNKFFPQRAETTFAFSSIFILLL